MTITIEVPKVQNHLVEECPECTSKNLIHDYDTGETICGDCGLVVYEQMMDKGPEWRAFTQQEKTSRSRVGMPTSYSIHDKGLSTAISQVDRDAFGRKLPLSTRLQMWRLRKWQIRSRVHSSVDRNLAQAMSELERLSGKVSISPPIREKASVVYRKALDKRASPRTINQLYGSSFALRCLPQKRRTQNPQRNLRRKPCRQKGCCTMLQTSSARTRFSHASCQRTNIRFKNS